MTGDWLSPDLTAAQCRALYRIAQLVHEDHPVVRRAVLRALDRATVRDVTDGAAQLAAALLAPEAG